ncbi:PLP-dependent aminotransferase family protein [Brevibacterium daeguense]|uniref:PLP-dependent aminotransferase family protein n=1 Tax=Brevibacterium daeguense TaxID=909936 RepID=A0ABP8EK05_9MICO|nr:PLP-dependent aminotransferase family protein [Brevibacterium daeguense]
MSNDSGMNAEDIGTGAAAGAGGAVGAGGRLGGASSLLSRLPGRQGFGDASLVTAGEGAIDLSGGNPDTSLLPAELHREAARDYFEGAGYASTLGYVPAPGIASLRATLAEREGVDLERIIVTNGGAHGLALAVLGTLDPGDTIVVDDPVYPLFLRTLDLLTGVTIESVGVEADGFDVDELEAKLARGLRPKAVFTVPTFHNPSGAVLSLEKSRHLTELAEKYGFIVFADDPYQELAFPGVEVPEHTWVRDSEHVMGIHTFAKTLGPALRLGWLVVPTHLSGQYVKMRNRIEGQTSGVLQELAQRIITRPEFAQVTRAAGAAYAQKARTLTNALHRELPGQLEIIEPQGGFFLWARFREQDADFARLYDAAQDEGLVYQRGEWFGVGEPARTSGCLRLTFAAPSVTDLEEGAVRLGRAWKRVTG